MTPPIYLLLLLATVTADEVTTPSSQLRPRDFNHHAFDAKQYLRELEIPETTRQGPVLFPNDAPPPPRPPLIVTSRPLLESVSRSELNNTIAQQTQLSHIIRPYLARVKEYRPYQYAIATETPQAQDYTVDNGNKYYYENHTPLPPIYKALSNHASQNLLEVQRHNVKDRYGYQVREPEYNRHQNHHNRNDAIKSHVDSEDYDQSKNYAFSYRVKDQKTGDDFSHSQRSSGSATNGEYRVRLPDGRMQIVSYTADENGYQANVRYDEEDKTSGNSIDNNYNDNANKYNNNQNQYNNNNYNDNNDHINDRVYVNDKHHYNDYTHKEYNDKHDTQHTAYQPDDLNKYKAPINNDYYNQYSDLSKEYYNDDLSSEYESKSYDYEPHKSKFTTFVDNKKTNLNHYASPKSNLALGSTVTPSYEELKDLLATKKAYNTVQPYVNKIPVQLNVPSTTPSYDFTTERVVFIGGKKPNLYTSVSSLPSVSTPSPLNFNSFVSSTPRNYLVSTIASLGNQVDLSGPKPVLSGSYIDRINKYLRFN